MLTTATAAAAVRAAAALLHALAACGDVSAGLGQSAGDTLLAALSHHAPPALARAREAGLPSSSAQRPAGAGAAASRLSERVTEVLRANPYLPDASALAARGGPVRAMVADELARDWWIEALDAWRAAARAIVAAVAAGTAPSSMAGALAVWACDGGIVLDVAEVVVAPVTAGAFHAHVRALAATAHQPSAPPRQTRCCTAKACGCFLCWLPCPGCRRHGTR